MKKETMVEREGFLWRLSRLFVVSPRDVSQRLCLARLPGTSLARPLGCLGRSVPFLVSIHLEASTNMAHYNCAQLALVKFLQRLESNLLDSLLQFEQILRSNF